MAICQWNDSSFKTIPVSGMAHEVILDRFVSAALTVYFIFFIRSPGGEMVIAAKQDEQLSHRYNRHVVD